MSKDVVTIDLDETLDVAMEKLGDHGVRRLMVVDGNDVLQGVLSWTDLVPYLSESGPRRVADRRKPLATRITTQWPEVDCPTACDRLLLQRWKFAGSQPPTSTWRPVMITQLRFRSLPWRSFIKPHSRWMACNFPPQTWRLDPVSRAGIPPRIWLSRER